MKCMYAHRVLNWFEIYSEVNSSFDQCTAVFYGCMIGQVVLLQTG